MLILRLHKHKNKKLLVNGKINTMMTTLHNSPETSLSSSKSPYQKAMRICVVLLCTWSYHASALEVNNGDNQRDLKKSINEQKEKKDVSARLENIKSEVAFLDDKFVEKVAKMRKEEMKEFKKIRASYEDAKAKVKKDDPDAHNILMSLYYTLLMEMSNKNKLNSLEIGANQILLVSELSPLEQELATMEENDFLMSVGQETYANTNPDLKKAIKEKRKDLQEDVLSLNGTFKSPFCCIVDNLNQKVDDYKDIEAFNNVLEFELNHILLGLDLNLIANGTDLVQQDWLHRVRSDDETNPEDITKDPFRVKEDSKVARFMSTQNRGNRLAMKIEIDFTCGSFCPKSCKKKQKEAKMIDNTNVEQLCTTHSGTITEKVTDLFSSRVRDFFLYVIKPEEEDQDESQSVEASCTPCGEGDLDEGFQPYVDPSTFKDIDQFLRQIDKLLDREYQLLKKFDQEVFIAKRAMVQKYDKEDYAYAKSVEKVNDFYVVKKRGKDSGGKDIQLLYPDYDAWELVLDDVNVLFAQAIMVINVDYMDTIDEKKFKFNSQMQDLRQKHRRLFEGLQDFNRVMAEEGRDELVHELEVQEQEEQEVRQRIKARQMSLAMEVAENIVCDIDGITEHPYLKSREVELMEFLFFLAMDASFRDADIDLVMVKTTVNQVCAVDKFSAEEIGCTAVQKGPPKRQLRTRYTLRRLRMSSIVRCNTCTRSRIYSNRRQLDSIELMPSSTDKDGMDRVVDHRILKETEESVLAKAEDADFFVDYVNFKFAAYLNKGFAHRLKEGMDSFKVKCSLG